MMLAAYGAQRSSQGSSEEQGTYFLSEGGERSVHAGLFNEDLHAVSLDPA